jgi:hypothetical protein
MIIWWLYDNCKMIIWWLYDNCKMIIRWSKDDFMKFGKYHLMALSKLVTYIRYGRVFPQDREKWADWRKGFPRGQTKG